MANYKIGDANYEIGDVVRFTAEWKEQMLRDTTPDKDPQSPGILGLNDAWVVVGGAPAYPIIKDLHGRPFRWAASDWDGHVHPGIIQHDKFLTAANKALKRKRKKKGE